MPGDPDGTVPLQVSWFDPSRTCSTASAQTSCSFRSILGADDEALDAEPQCADVPCSIDFDLDAATSSISTMRNQMAPDSFLR